ncbi:MAG TPA: carboxy terminal-processing peptidase [Xanthomonadaceae bacterium]|nr:carboxy terminal-processing peptidase [Xanthomonadaceae bacterium]
MSRTLIPALILLLAPLLAEGKREATDSEFAALAPKAGQSQAAVWATRFLTRFHYANQALDDDMSSKILDRYLQSLDSERLFFTAADIDSFEDLRGRLDDAIHDQSLEPAFTIFNLYVRRVAERTTHARAILQNEFDFGTDETYQSNRSEQPWAKDSEALDALWRMRVKNDIIRLKLAGRDIEDIRKTLDRRYANFEKRVRELNSEDVFQTFMNAYAVSIEPHTGYLGPRASENFNISMRLSLEGIGAVLQREDEYTVVRSIVPGGPAALSGKLKAGDRILGVGQGGSGPLVDVVGWRLDDVVELIRGPKDSVVRLDVQPAEAGPDGKHEVITITRQRIKLEEQAAKRSVIEIEEGGDARRIGIIALPTFYQDFEARRRGDPDYRSTSRDVSRLLEELKADGVDGVVLDLRNNGGGSLNEATELTGLFIESGPVVQVRNSQGRVDVETDRSKTVVYDGPLAVLVNRSSASASEIVAAAIQDYGRGIIIGEPTFGKGTVQNLIDLDQVANNESPRFGQLRMTIAQFYRISGGSTQHRGVVPDIAYPVSIDPDEYGESAYDNALPYTTIAPASYRAYGDLSALLPVLEARHIERVAADTEFQFWKEDIADFRERRKQTEISLNLETRRSERDALEARREARKKARQAAGLQVDAATEPVPDDGLTAEERGIAAGADADDDAQVDDVLLTEAARVLNDAISLLRRDTRLAAMVKVDVRPSARRDGETARVE